MPNPIMASSEMVDVLSEVVSGRSSASRGAAFGERGDNGRAVDLVYNHRIGFSPNLSDPNFDAPELDGRSIL